MSWVAVAIGGSALLGYASSQNAAGAQTDAANNANATQLSMYNQQRRDSMPWQQAGRTALNDLLYGLGHAPQSSFTDEQKARMANLERTIAGLPQNALTDPRRRRLTKELQSLQRQQQEAEAQLQANAPQGGQGDFTRDFSMSDFQEDPGYKFRMEQGMKAIDRAAAARGMGNSGRTLKALSNYGQESASQEYTNAYNRFNNDRNQRFNRLSSLAGIGQTATSQLGNAAQNYGNQVSANQLAAGNAQAAGYIGGANAINSGIGGIANNWMQQQYLNKYGGK